LFVIIVTFNAYFIDISQGSCSVFCVVIYLRIFGKIKIKFGLIFPNKNSRSIFLKLFIFRT